MWRSGSWFHVLVSGAMTRTAILTLDGRTDEALAFLDQIEHYADRQGIPRLHSALLVHRARLLLRAGREEQAAALVNGEEFQAIIDADADAALAPIREPALALRARLGHDAATAEQAIASLQRIADAAAATGHLRREVPARLALAVSIARLHGAEAAFAQLTEILRKSEAGEFVRSFLDEGEPLTALLQALVSARAAFPQACIERAHVLLADLERAKLATGSNAGSDDHALSQREREVLELLAKGMSSKEMAGALRVSAGTVKVHRKRLYRKLGAHNRSAALAVARSRKLVQLGVQDPLSLQAAGHARRRGGVNENGVAGSGNAVFDNSGSSGAPPLADDVTSDRSDPRSSPSSRP
jgi:LuxR family transcriptional regulator, maltose regulon positive regulatory protein